MGKIRGFHSSASLNCSVSWVVSLCAISPTVKTGQNTYFRELLDAEMS